MAKKQTKVSPQADPGDEHVEQVVVKTPPVVKEQSKRKEPSYKKAEDGWEIKDRTYFLKNKQKPLSYKIKTANIYWFDENKGFERELKYC